MQTESFVPPSLQDLAARLLTGQAGAHARGLAAFDLGEVTPYEAGPVQPLEPQAAWREALTALSSYVPKDQTAAGAAQTAPPHWPQLVANHEPLVALPFCVGNFPQLVRNFHQVLQGGASADVVADGGRPVQAPQLIAQAQEVAAERRFPDALVILGTLRLAKQFDEADRFISALEGAVPGMWRAGWDNEKAALAWRRGDVQTARALWAALPPSLPVRFNRAMAEVFTGDPALARADLAEVVKELPETSAWHHLARLYLTLATMR